MYRGGFGERLFIPPWPLAKRKKEDTGSGLRLRNLPSTSCTLTSFQNLFCRAVVLPSFAFLMTLACFSSSDCFRRRSIRSFMLRTAGVGGSGGGPVPRTEATLAALYVVAWRGRVWMGMRMVRETARSGNWVVGRMMVIVVLC